MAALKTVSRNQRVRLRNGRSVKLNNAPEPSAVVWYGVRFADGATVFMPRARAGAPATRDLAELRAHALRVRAGQVEADIDGVEQACERCARSIPGCAGCAHSAAVSAAAKAKEPHD